MRKKDVTSDAVQSLLALYEQGRQRSLWENKSDCGRKFGISPEDFRNQTNGYRPDEVVAGTVTKLREVLSGDATIPSTVEPPSPSNPFRELFEQGCARGTWTDKSACARVLGIERATLRRYLGGVDVATASPQLRTYAKRLLATMRRKTAGEPEPREKVSAPRAAPRAVKPSSPSPIEQLSRALEGVMNLASTSVVEKVQGALTKPLSEVVREEISGLRDGIKDVRDLLEQALAAPREVGTAEKQPETPPPGVIPSRWAEEVIAGRMELAGQSLPGVRFVLTAPPFQKLLSSFTQGERRDTVELIRILRIGLTELRRRLTVSAQVADPAEGSKDVEELGAELDALMIEIERCGDADICATAELRRQQREELDRLRLQHRREKNYSPREKS